MTVNAKNGTAAPSAPGARLSHPALSRGRLTTVWRRIAFYAALLILWELAARARIWPSYVFPSPLDVLNALASGLRKGVYLQAMAASVRNVAVGYGISLILGVALGLVIGRVRALEETVGSLVVGLQSLPSVCWLPLAILWVGLNERAIILVVVLGALFSITLGVDAGVKNTPPRYVNAARNLGAGGFGLYAQVILPSALPAILAGLKQGWAFAWRSLMAGELIYYSLSLGNLLQTGRDLNDVAMVMSVMALIVVVGVSVDQLLFAPLERRVRERWGFSAQSR
jgi:NitT/TauT family transport system permease protein